MTVEKKTSRRKKNVEVVFKKLSGETDVVYFEIHDDAISLPQEMKEKLQLSIINSLKHGEYVFNKTTAEKYLERISNEVDLKKKLKEKESELQDLKMKLKSKTLDYSRLQEKLEKIPYFLRVIFNK